MWITKILAIGLFSTLVIELGFALFWKVEKCDLKIVALANILTNPLVVLTFYIFQTYLFANAFLISILELFAVIIECVIYRKKTNISKPILFGVLANALSYIIGFLIF